MTKFVLLFDKIGVQPLLVCLLIVAATAILYYPGLSGIFLLDDFHTLEPLGAYGRGLNSFDEFIQYVFSGNTGPTGRPVSLLSFTLNSQSWPVPSAYYFLLTSVLIHAINGALVFLFIKRLLILCLDSESIAFRIALTTSLIWVLHPFHVSSVLYVVQRMTLLSATFSLLGLICYLPSRQWLSEGRLSKAIPGLLGVGLCALLALFSKENALSLPLQILVVEAFLFAVGVRRSRLNSIFMYVIVMPLSMIVVGYLVWHLIIHAWDYSQLGVEKTYGRSFTMTERLLTELRVVGDYLYATVLPKMQSSGIYYDGYEVSKGLAEPLSTLIWFFIHSLLVFGAWSCRYRAPVIFFGVFWFYASHLLESTTIMLELKFDHRNYVPSIGIIFVVAYYICFIPRRLVRYSLQAGTIGLCTLYLSLSASLWGDPLKASMVWVEESPLSARSLGNAARQQFLLGRIERAKGYLRREISISGSPTTELVFVADFCETYDHKKMDVDSLAERIVEEQQNWQLYKVLGLIVNDMLAGRCDLLGLNEYLLLLDAYRNNPAYNANLSLLLMDEYEIKARLHNDLIAAAVDLSDKQKDIPLAYAMNRAGVFARFDQLEYAVEFLGEAIYTPSGSYREDHYTLKNATEVLELMRQDLNNKAE